MRISPILQRAPLGAFFLLCLLWTFGSPAWAQTVEETHHKNGSIFERFEVNEAGQKIGSYERFRSDGTLERIATFAEGRLHGTATEFDELTRLSLQANYVRGLRQGTWKEYRDGIPYLSAKYHKDLLQGAWEQFDAQGERHILAHYSKGILHGKFIEERPEGKWGRTANYRDGLLDGKAKITVKRKTVSKRTWKAGQLLNLDGMTPFPVALPQLAATLKEALQPMEPDAEDPMSEERLGELARLKAYRALCGIPWRNLALKPEWNSLCDAAGALCDAIGRLDHTPKKPEGMDDQAYTRGYRGTSSSNLSSGGLRGSVDSYMDDSDPSNIDRLGHRRWCLNPQHGLDRLWQKRPVLRHVVHGLQRTWSQGPRRHPLPARRLRAPATCLAPGTPGVSNFSRAKCPAKKRTSKSASSNWTTCIKPPASPFPWTGKTSPAEDLATHSASRFDR